MLIVRLTGGLGNQLFQYALARRLAYARSEPFKLDISGFATYKLHKYSLGHFNIMEDFARPEEVAAIAYGANVFAKAARKLGNKLKPYYRRSIIAERQYNFDPEVLKAGGDAYLVGYWQTEKYFKDIESVIRQDLAFKTAPDDANAQMARQIAACNAVSLHVRRGDYVSDPRINTAHGATPLEYYRKAVDLLAAKAPDIHIFIFTDDPEWARHNISFNQQATLIANNNAGRNYEDLRLMSLCKHNIVANSSFGWWGAWLNQNPSKIVIAPAEWVQSPALKNRDLIPEHWICL